MDKEIYKEIQIGDNKIPVYMCTKFPPDCGIAQGITTTRSLDILEDNFFKRELVAMIKRKQGKPRYMFIVKKKHSEIYDIYAKLD